MNETIAAIVGIISGVAATYFFLKMGSSASAGKERPTELASEPASPEPAPAPVPVRSDAIALLATLQREARFIDIVKEPLGDYSDEQVGAAARDVLRDCGAVLDRVFQIEPVVDQEEGTTVEIPNGEISGKFRITGNADATATSGALVHHGWQAKKCELPNWTGDKEAALIIAAAELEVK